MSSKLLFVSHGTTLDATIWLSYHVFCVVQSVVLGKYSVCMFECVLDVVVVSGSGCGNDKPATEESMQATSIK